MKNSVIIVFAILFMAQCRPRDPEVAPSLAKLVGTWQLLEPDSSNAITLEFALDTANPPRDITHFLANGKSTVNTYTAFLSAAIDGYMVITDVGSTKIGGSPEAMTIEQTYLTNLRNVVRYAMPSDSQLRLSHGGDKPGTLVYKRIR